MAKRIAVVLAGCGSRDGTEITEAVTLIVALSQRAFQVEFFSPDRNQHHVINHLSGNDEKSDRNLLTEAARIARGKIAPLSALQVDLFDALIFPGGFGVAKNLCNFAFVGIDAVLQEDVKRVLVDAIKARKALGALCIAPILLALGARECALRGAQITLGRGDATDAIGAIEAWGAKHVASENGVACVDRVCRFVTAPAYMINDASPADIYDSANALVKALEELI